MVTGDIGREDSMATRCGSVVMRLNMNTWRYKDIVPALRHLKTIAISDNNTPIPTERCWLAKGTLANSWRGRRPCQSNRQRLQVDLD